MTPTEIEAAMVVLGTLPDLTRRERDEVFETLDADAFPYRRHGELFLAWRHAHCAASGPITVDHLDVEDDLRALALDLWQHEATIGTVDKWLAILVEACDRRRLRAALADAHERLDDPTEDRVAVAADVRARIEAMA